jgi:hypothetical protein
MLCVFLMADGAVDYAAMTAQHSIEIFAVASVTSCKSFKVAEPRLKSLSNHPPVHVSAQRSAVDGSFTTTGSQKRSTHEHQKHPDLPDGLGRIFCDERPGSLIPCRLRR